MVFFLTFGVSGYGGTKNRCDLEKRERPFPVNLSSTANETSQKWPKTTQITFRGGKLRMTGWFRG